MAGLVASFIPAIVAGRQRATVRRFKEARADDAARARTLQELGVRNDHLFNRLVRAGVVGSADGGRYFLSADGLARWKRNSRVGVLVAALLVLVGVLIALGLTVL